MSDYKEAPSTEDEIEDVISEAKKAAKAQNPNKSGRSNRNRYRNRNKNRTKAQDEESSENLFSEIDSVADAENDEDLSPKMESAQSVSNAFAAAKEKREQDLRKKRFDSEVSEEDEDEVDEEEDDVEIEEDDDFDEEESDFEVDSEENEENEEDEESDEDEDDGDSEEDDEEYDGIFDTDDENEEYIANVDEDVDDVEIDDDDDDDDEDDEDEDEDDDDEEEGAFSTKAKVIIGIIIAILVIAIIGAAIFFLNSGETSGGNQNTVSQAADGSVTGIHFAEPSISLKVGETKPLEIVIEPESAKDKMIKIKSNNMNIAKVDEKGRITGVSSGSTTVTATLKSNETIVASLIVNVIDDDQDAINTYNKFVNAIIDGSTDIDPDTDTEEETQAEQQYDEFGNPIESTDTDTDKDTDSDHKTIVQKDVLTGNIIKDLDGDGAMDLALYYKGARDNSKVRIFRLADPDEVPEETEETEEQQYDEFGNPIEPETDTEQDTDSSADNKNKESSSEKVITEVEPESELYNKCYGVIETEGASWNTSYLEIKEEESAKAKVTILSSGYKSPSYTYEVEDKTVATVDAQGNIKAVKPGVTFVTVSSPLNSDAMSKIKVRVKDDTDLLDDYLAKIPVVNQTNDAVLPTETLTGKAIVDIDNDGVSELLLRFDYGNHIQTIEMVKVENEKCVVYKTYNNISELYEYAEGNGYYNNTILVHYTSGKVCMEYRGVVAKTDSKSRTTDQKILSIESGGNLNELVYFKTSTDITVKTVTSQVEIYTDDDDTSSISSVTSSEDEWYGDDDTSSTVSDDDDNTYYGDDDYDDNEYYPSYAALTFEDIEEAEENGMAVVKKKAAKVLPEAAGAPDDEYDDGEDSNDNDNNDNDNNDDNDYEYQERETVTSTVTSEIEEETTKYFVNGSSVEKSVYEEMLATFSARYSVWNAWESVQ